jgi:hypothetical protein
MSKIVSVRTGGQSGADRGAMDAARECGVPVVGWCPKGGWAEDLPDPPGIRALYPQMTETPLADVSQRTEWNIRDSTCCITINTADHGTSPGTDLGYACYEKYGTPHFEIVLDDPEPLGEQVERARAWLCSLNDDTLVLGVGGPRASEYPGVYDIAYNVVKTLLGNRGRLSE